MLLQDTYAYTYAIMIIVVVLVLFCLCAGEKVKEQFRAKTLWTVFLIGLPAGIVCIIIGIMIIELGWFLMIGFFFLIIGMFAIPKRSGTYK